MSKSKRNGVDPQSLIEQYGADTARFFMMFAAPPEQTLEWSDAGVEGAHRFLRRVWNYAHLNKGAITQAIQLSPSTDENNVPAAIKNWRREIHVVLKQANFDLKRQQFNTVASASMKILNALESVPNAENKDRGDANEMIAALAVMAEGFSILLRLLSPIAPHITQALWKELGYGDDILAAAWPEPSDAALVQDEVELVIQVNGKLRGNMTVSRTLDKANIETLVVQQPCVQKFLADGLSVRKIIVVPNKLINVVVG